MLIYPYQAKNFNSANETMNHADSNESAWLNARGSGALGVLEHGCLMFLRVHALAVLG